MILKILLQLLIFALFILGNGYQSVITNFMIEPTKNTLFKTYDEVLESNYEFFSSAALDVALEDHPSYQMAKREGRVLFNYSHGEGRYSFVYNCYIIKKQDDNKFYTIEFSKFFFRVEVGYWNPLLAQFQHLLDRALEGGLIRAWEEFYTIELREFKRIYEPMPKVIVPLKQELNLEEILPICVILLIGLAIAFVAFLGEILHYKVKRWREGRTRVIYLRGRNQRIP